MDGREKNDKVGGSIEVGGVKGVEVKTYSISGFYLAFLCVPCVLYILT